MLVENYKILTKNGEFSDKFSNQQFPDSLKMTNKTPEQKREDPTDETDNR